MFLENFRRLLDPEFGIGVSKGHYVVVYHHLLDYTQVDGIMSQFVHKLQPPRAEHVVCEDELFIR